MGLLSLLFSWNTFWWALVSGVVWILVNSVRVASSKGPQQDEAGGHGSYGGGKEDTGKDC